MSEKPIIMTGESVQAILQGRKTMTRRVINPGLYLQCIDPEEDEGKAVLLDVCPYGRVGGVLWVRETFRLGSAWDDHCDPKILSVGDVYYKADDDFTAGTRWRPAMYMPRNLCRLRLKIVSVRVERVRSISYADCIAEGIVDTARQEKRTRQPGEAPYDQYRALWDSLNARRGYGWDVDPWVFVIEFKRIKP